MSSVDWKKLHNGKTEMIAMISHAARYDGDENVKYRNKFIDKSRSVLNYTVSTDGMDDDGNVIKKRMGGTRFYEILRLQNRIKIIDQKHPPKRRRKDRVIAVSFVVSVPEMLDEKNEKLFFEMAYGKIVEMCGGVQNVSIGYVHKDEVHEYVDAVTGEERTSLPHLHCTGLPFIEGRGLNGRDFMTESRMRQLNKAIDEECQNRFGCRFLTGLKARSGRSVEDLQLASEKKAREQSREREQALRIKMEEMQAEELRLEDLRKKAQEEEKRIEEHYGKIARMYNALLQAYKLLKERARELKVAIDDKELSAKLHELVR